MSEATVEKPQTAANGEDAAVGPKTAYISASGSIDVSSVRSSLERRGIHAFSPDQLDLPGQNLSQILREALRRADLVVGVVDPTPDSNFVFYELGFAQGMGKPTLVLLSGDVSPSPWNASGIPYFRFDPAKPTGVEFGISQILKMPQHGSPVSSTPPRRTQPLGARADALLAQLRAGGDTIPEEEMVAILEDALRASGATTVSKGGGADEGVDLAVWSDDLSPWVGNPLPIEVKRTVRSLADLRAAAGHLSRAMAGGSRWGLLIYLQSEGTVLGAATLANVLCISVENFLEGLRTTGFGELIRRLRNERVHGGS